MMANREELVKRVAADLEQRQLSRPVTEFGRGWNCGLEEAVDRIRAIAELTQAPAQALIDDVRRRYPGEDLRCDYMIALDQALSRPAEPVQGEVTEAGNG